jgi:hypothetical protein
MGNASNPMKPIKRKNTGRITPAQARKLFGEIAAAREMQRGEGSPEISDAWNWFFAGVEIAQTARVKGGHVAWLRKSAAAKSFDSQNAAPSRPQSL